MCAGEWRKELRWAAVGSALLPDAPAWVEAGMPHQCGMRLLILMGRKRFSATGPMEQRLRPDGRFDKELRRIQIEHEAADSCGTIVLSQGLSKAQASLTKLGGRGQLNIALRFHDTSRCDQVTDRQLYVLQTKLVDIFSTVIACEHQVNIDLAVLQDDGSMLAVLINTVTLCLCYHGVPTVGMCTSVCLNESYDLCTKEQGRGFVATVVYLVNTEQLVYFKSVGKCQRGPLKEALKNGIDCCKAIGRHFSAYLVGSASSGA